MLSSSDHSSSSDNKSDWYNYVLTNKRKELDNLYKRFKYICNNTDNYPEFLIPKICKLEQIIINIITTNVKKQNKK